MKHTSLKSTRLKIHNKQPREMLIRKRLMIINSYHWTINLLFVQPFTYLYYYFDKLDPKFAPCSHRDQRNKFTPIKKRRKKIKTWPLYIGINYSEFLNEHVSPLQRYMKSLRDRYLMFKVWTYSDKPKGERRGHNTVRPCCFCESTVTADIFHVNKLYGDISSKFLPFKGVIHNTTYKIPTIYKHWVAINEKTWGFL